jgi:hypothetical protein
MVEQQISPQTQVRTDLRLLVKLRTIEPEECLEVKKESWTIGRARQPSCTHTEQAGQMRQSLALLQPMSKPGSIAFLSLLFLENMEVTENKSIRGMEFF